MSPHDVRRMYRRTRDDPIAGLNCAQSNGRPVHLRAWQAENHLVAGAAARAVSVRYTCYAIPALLSCQFAATITDLRHHTRD